MHLLETDKLPVWPWHCTPGRASALLSSPTITYYLGNIRTAWQKSAPVGLMEHLITNKHYMVMLSGRVCNTHPKPSLVLLALHQP
jgi:hypothetical protein